MFLAVNDQRVPSVVPTLEARHRGRAFSEQIYNLALALVAPLRTDDHDESTHSVTWDLAMKQSVASAASGRIEVFEELAFRLDDHDVPLTTQRITIRLQAAIEAIELGRFAVG